jgi:hypothetical protein
MSIQSTKKRHSLLAIAGVVAWLSIAPALAQTSNFEGLTLSTFPPANATVEGRTVGTFALSNIADTDSTGALCLGYAATNPDHILVLQNDFPSLTITVNSGQDTTLLIQGPDDNTVYCGQDISRRNLDAQVARTGVKAGTYRVWVGSHTQGQRFNYTLSVTE